MPFRPLRNAIVVRLHADPPRQVGSIVIPDSAAYTRADWQTATVVAVGNGNPVPAVHCPECQVPMTCPCCGRQQPTRARIDLEPGDEVLLERGLLDSGFLELHEIDGERVYMVPEGHVKVKAERPQAPARSSATDIGPRYTPGPTLEDQWADR